MAQTRQRIRHLSGYQTFVRRTETTGVVVGCCCCFGGIVDVFYVGVMSCRYDFGVKFCDCR